LTQAERAGGNAAKLEAALATARSRASEPWGERIAGAQAATRDADRLIREHISANFAALLDVDEADGRIAAELVNQKAQELVDAVNGGEGTGSRMGLTIAQVRRPGPGDVTRSRADEAARAAARLLAEGGEEPPRLDRTIPPWSELLVEREPAAVA